MKQRFQIVPAVYLLLRQEDKILLIRRYNTGYMDGKYSLPAGHLDGGESATRALVREAKEEIGIKLKSKDLRFLHVLHRRAAERDHERVDFFFEASKWLGSVINAEPDKCDDLKWTEISKLPKQMVPEVRYVLDKISAGEIYSELDF